MKEAQLYLFRELSGIYSDNELQSVTRLVLSHITGLNFTGLLLNKNTTFSDNQWYDLKKYSALLKSGMPVQYVLGKTEFCGLEFNLSPEVLIPRPETEELVEWAVELLPPNATVLDIGTGSGCIAVSIQHLRRDCNVWACDVSESALAIATENARKNSVNVHFFSSDVLKDELPEMHWDFIISNPPYIPVGEAIEMEARVTEFEPGLALFVPDNDPLLFYKVIAKHSCTHLKPDGHLMVEVHRSFASDCLHLFESSGFNNGVLKKDISGNNRMIDVIKN